MLLDSTLLVLHIHLNMKIILIVVTFFISVLEGAAVQKVRGHIGEELSIHCFSNWAFNDSYDLYNMHFCKGPCSSQNLLVEKTMTAIRQRGRYRMLEGNSTVFSVTIKRLWKTDAGRYFCGRDRNGAVQSQQLIVTVLEGATVPLELSPLTTTVQTSELSSFSDTTWPSAGLSPLPTSKGSNRAATAGLTDTTVVIIVSVSLALLVCAIIPLIFYGHWRSSGENQTTAGDKAGEDSDEHTDIPLTQTTVALQTDDTDTETPDCVQYASIDQALDPQSLD